MDTDTSADSFTPSTRWHRPRPSSIATWKVPSFQSTASVLDVEDELGGDVVGIGDGFERSRHGGDADHRPVIQFAGDGLRRGDPVQ